MAPLKNPRHEAFVHSYLKCGDATKAFELAGYTRDSANAHRLLNRPKVQARLRELQDEIAVKVPITIESLIAELEEARQHATGKNQYSAAIKAILGKAQLAGRAQQARGQHRSIPGRRDYGRNRAEDD
jgi:phage terminase small subunit